MSNNYLRMREEDNRRRQTAEVERRQDAQARQQRENLVSWERAQDRMDQVEALRRNTTEQSRRNYRP